MIKNTVKKTLKNKPRAYEFAVVCYNFLVQIKNLILIGTIQEKYFILLKNKRLMYLVNNKVACSSIKKTFIKELIEDDNMSIHKYDWDYILKHKYIKDDNSKFTFVRNPFSRIVSCYVDKYTLPRGKPEGVGVFDRYLLGIIKKDKGFRHFVKMISLIPSNMAESHFYSQYLLLFDKCNKPIVDYVGKFENINDDFDVLRRKFNLEKLPHYHKSPHEDWMDYYNLKTAKIIYKKYKKDIEEFGYQNDYDKLVQYIKGKE